MGECCPLCVVITVRGKSVGAGMWCIMFKVRLMACAARRVSRVGNGGRGVSILFHFTVPDDLGRCSCHWWPLGGESQVAVVLLALARHASVRAPSK